MIKYDEVLLESIRIFKERLKYPIISIYIIVLILWNWDVLSYYFFSNDTIENRIDYINTHYHDCWGRILWPLLKAVILVVAIPFIMYVLEIPLLKINKSRRKIKSDNNKDIRDEKLAQAEHEYEISEARTGKKTIEEWEQKIRDFEGQIQSFQANSSKITEVYKSENENLLNVNDKLSADYHKVSKENSELKGRVNELSEINGFYSHQVNGFREAIYDAYSIRQLVRYLAVSSAISSKSFLNVINKVFGNEEHPTANYVFVEKKMLEELSKKEYDILQILINNEVVEKNNDGYKLNRKGIYLQDYLTRSPINNK